MTNHLPEHFLPTAVTDLFQANLIAKFENPVRQLAVQAGALRGLGRSRLANQVRRSGERDDGRQTFRPFLTVLWG